jgi:hypothetical protein
LGPVKLIKKIYIHGFKDRKQRLKGEARIERFEKSLKTTDEWVIIKIACVKKAIRRKES